ncbi:hypothetical protein SAMN05216490_4269 [Mucilaginibacter mallensis]|uniref:Uncharacterized protein n=1 Tax=Mucilaginibacter mallensis TaxID=652787 RepID=A0A1H2BQ61_MUCMA|nr:hypothetical protein SAMN05216490_4269 [Mucilaginibacter mallensis]
MFVMEIKTMKQKKLSHKALARIRQDRKYAGIIRDILENIY